jgi:hypothetical protein
MLLSAEILFVFLIENNHFARILPPLSAVPPVPPKYTPAFNTGLEFYVMRGFSIYLIRSFIYAACTTGHPNMLASLSYKKVISCYYSTLCDFSLMKSTMNGCWFDIDANQVHNQN